MTTASQMSKHCLAVNKTRRRSIREVKNDEISRAAQQQLQQHQQQQQQQQQRGDVFTVAVNHTWIIRRLFIRLPAQVNAGMRIRRGR